MVGSACFLVALLATIQAIVFHNLPAAVLAAFLGLLSVSQ
jgi:hypothetical protein